MILHRLNRLGGGFGQISASIKTPVKTSSTLSNLPSKNKRKATLTIDRLASTAPPTKRPKKSRVKAQGRSRAKKKKSPKLARKSQSKKHVRLKKASYAKKKKRSTKNLRGAQSKKAAKRKNQSKPKIAYGSIFG